MKTGKFGLLLTVTGLAVLITVSSCKKEKSSLRSKDYALSAVTTGATGTVTISENADKSFNIKVNVNKTFKDTVHLVKLYSGSLSTPGALALALGNITGTGNAVSSEARNIKQIKLADNSMKNVTYDSIVNYKAFIKVFHSEFRGDSLLARGNVGNN
jgi:hypothetical protein